MKKQTLRKTAFAMLTALFITSLSACGKSGSEENQTTTAPEADILPSLTSWDGVSIRPHGTGEGTATLCGTGIRVTSDVGRASNVLSFDGSSGILELPKDIWQTVTDAVTIAFSYKAASDASDDACLFQTNISGYETGDTFWKDAPEISLTAGGTLRIYAGTRTINGELQNSCTYNNGVGDDDLKYAEPHGYKPRYSAKFDAPSKGEWHQVVLSIAKDSLHIYVDGNECTYTAQTPTDDLTSTLTYLFGAFDEGETLFPLYKTTSVSGSVYKGVSSFKGDVDDIAVYYRALSSSEAASLPKDAAYLWSFDTADLITETPKESSDLSKYLGTTPLTEATRLTAVSPDGKKEMKLWTDTDGHYYYSITDNDEVIVESSLIGIETKEGALWEALTLEESSIQTSSFHETYPTFTGPRTEATNHYNETSFVLKNDAGSFRFVIRAYDDGIAYRYEDVTAGSGAVVTMLDEKSEVILPHEAVTWAFPLNGTYEGEFVKRTGRQLQALSQLLSTPVLAQTGTHWTLISEAAVFNNDGSYCSSALQTSSDSMALNWTFGLARDPARESTGELDSPGHIAIKEFETKNGFRTPWRVFVVSDDLNTFTQTNLIGNLNPEPDSSLYADTSYIKPGKVAWSWWAEGDQQNNYEKHVEYIDFAAENGWEYVCLDVGWTAFENRLAQLCDYAKEKGVGIFVWVNYRDIKTQENRDLLFSRWAKAGAVGIKADYFESDEPSVLKVMEDTAITCAKNKLMLLYHGCVRPGGEYRTYPNVLSMEAVQGEEYHKWFNYPSVQNCLVYPFTRNVLGSMDFTPVATKSGGNEATYGFGLAQAVVYESALQHLAYAASSYKNYTGLALLNHLPTAWDDTRLLEGMPGEYVTIARQNGENWWIGAMTQNARTAAVSLDFLNGTGYHAYIYEDKEDGTCLAWRMIDVTSTDCLELNLSDFGGAAVLLTKGTIDTTIGTNSEFNSPDFTYYEAESKSNLLAGTAVTAGSAFCSGGQKVGYVGNGAGNTLTFPDIQVDESGSYTLRLFYCCGEKRKVVLTVNGEEYIMENLNSGDYVHPAVAEISIPLKTGSNTIMLSNPSYYAPDIDRIAISKKTQ